jgi:hypothetical protein
MIIIKKVIEEMKGINIRKKYFILSSDECDNIRTSTSLQELFEELFQVFGRIEIGENIIIDDLKMFKSILDKLDIDLEDESNENISKLIDFLNGHNLENLYSKRTITYFGKNKIKENVEKETEINIFI